jgi:hypothetical protein
LGRRRGSSSDLDTDTFELIDNAQSLNAAGRGIERRDGARSGAGMSVTSHCGEAPHARPQGRFNTDTPREGSSGIVDNGGESPDVEGH